MEPRDLRESGNMILTVTMNPAIDTLYEVPNFALGKVQRPNKTLMTAGGKGLNVARVAKLLGEHVGATGLLGGSRGEFIGKSIENQGIMNLFTPIEGESRICINIIDSTHRGSTEILERGPSIQEHEYRKFLDNFAKLAKDASVITLSGSLSQGVPDDCYRTLVECGDKVFLDSSGVAFQLGLQAKPYMVKPNEDEIASLYPDLSISPKNISDDLLTAIQRLSDSGVTLPVVTLGSQGSLVGVDSTVYLIKTPKVSVVNTVGSGDSYIAGCAVGAHRGYDPIDMVILGTACGTVNALYEHTGFITPHEVEDCKREITYEPIGSWK